MNLCTNIFLFLFIALLTFYIHRSRSKYEKQKEKERHRIEKTEQKIEKEKQKLERLKQKLETVEILSEAKVEGVTEEFAKKLHQWEVMKGLKPSSPVVMAETTSPLKASLSASNFNR